ncbi:Versicolorin B synthase [Madurella mycetomatis]|uniref:Versicolorin B synthase n=1 Tax=Madurella mycetomatis TaxID=100816 RepID=A0A175W7V0_9PEZI|nr:Versicolorin B synthase [Madurella mycetomatis]
MRLALILSLSALGAAAPAENVQESAANELGDMVGKLGSTATFDYIIVGGGTAGLVLANRLSTNSNISVAVIEAGSFYEVTNPIISQTPVGDVLFAGADPTDTNPLVDWNFVTEPQIGANNRKIHYARGKCLGGSSARNFMIYQRGSKQSYQQWADRVGDHSYTWENLQPHFKKSIQFTPPSNTRFANASAEFDASAFSTQGGPLQVSYANYAQSFSTWLEPALNEIGVPHTDDFNSGTLMGAQYCASTIRPKDQTRDSSQTSFLKDARGRRNLKIYINTLATKIVFDDDKRATGVRVESRPAGLIQYTLHARREVILSAGAFQSPQLLMVSGIGPREELGKHSIPIISDRPGVGQTMEDHVFFGPTWRVRLETLTRVANDPVWVLGQFLGPYTLKKEGPLTNPVCDFLGWEKIPRSLLPDRAISVLNATFPPDWPELEYLTAPGYVGAFSNLFTTQPKDGFNYATILGGLVAPLSRGTVTLQSADARDLPIIDPNWLTDQTDVDVAIATYKRLRAAFASEAMRPVLLGNEYFPGAEVETDEEILETIRETVMTIWHAACTCRMGKPDDPMAVVDKDAKVIGVRGLRVVDASSFALLPPGHPQSTVYVLAEKIASQILDGR